jgi:hypothetical protein
MRLKLMRKSKRTRIVIHLEECAVMTTEMMCGGWRYGMRNAWWYWNNPTQWSHRRRGGRRRRKTESGRAETS